MINKQLENDVLKRAVQRFRKTNLDRIETLSEHNALFELTSYSLKIKDFTLRLSYSKQLSNHHEICELSLNAPDGYSTDYFNSLNQDYSPLLMETYFNLRRRFAEQAEQEEIKNIKENEKKLRWLKRVL